MRATSIVIFTLLILLSCPARSGVAAPVGAARAPTPCFLQRASDAISRLQNNWYNPQTGLWNTTGWWNAANAVTVLVEYSKLSASDQYLSAVSSTFSRNVRRGFLNNYYDDEGWWALAWIAAYDQTHKVTYLNAASSIFANMTTGWDDTCGGGVWWSKDRAYKNAIANELFLSVAARLANRVTDTSQRAAALSWAQREWQWFSQSGMINSENLINDGLSSNCRNNHKTEWSYNQGVILGGLSALFADTHDAALLKTAQAIAMAAISHLTDSHGTLHDVCEPNCGADGVQFKGIFVRNLARLDRAVPQRRYATFLRANAESIWKNDQGPGYQFGQVWSGPFENQDSGNAASQTSAIDAFLAAAGVSSQ